MNIKRLTLIRDRANLSHAIFFYFVNTGLMAFEWQWIDPSFTLRASVEHEIPMAAAIDRKFWRLLKGTTESAVGRSGALRF
jgi:hypothetical protein